MRWTRDRIETARQWLTLAAVGAAVLLALVFGSAAARGAEPAPMPHPAAGDKAEPPVSHADVLKAAAADAKALPPAVAGYTRYYDARSFPAATRRKSKGVFDGHLNLLSRGPRVIPSREVTPWLWAVRLDEYGWPADVWEALAAVNPYYLIPVEIKAAPVAPPAPAKVKKTRTVLVGPDRYGRYREDVQEYEEEVPFVGPPAPPVKVGKDFIPGPWLPPADIAELARLTGSKTPVLRADHFVFRTAIQQDRDGHGYYDFNGYPAKKDEFEKLLEFDRRAAVKVFRELGAIIPTSGVTLNNRQLFRFNGVLGAWWESRDTKDNEGPREAISNLLEDFKPDAFEVVVAKPNGMPGSYLADAAGKRQNTAPDFIARNRKTTNNDGRVHVGLSCVGCHTKGGLHPFDDYARKVYNPETGAALGVLDFDPVKTQRLLNVYLGPLQKAFDRDVSDFTDAIKEATGGLEPAEFSEGYVGMWSDYLDKPVTRKQAAADAGVSEGEFVRRLRAYAADARARGKPADPVVMVLGLADPLPLRREVYEGRVALLNLIVMGAYP